MNRLSVLPVGWLVGCPAITLCCNADGFHNLRRQCNKQQIDDGNNNNQKKSRWLQFDDYLESMQMNLLLSSDGSGSHTTKHPVTNFLVNVDEMVDACRFE